MNELFGPNCPWYRMYELFGESNVKWCEERVCTWFNEPANTWSNLAYILVAGLILKSACKETNPSAATVQKRYGWAVFIMGAFSFWYHASNNYFTQIFDFIGMFIWLVYLMIINLKRLGYANSKNAFPLYITFIALLTAVIPVLKSADIKFQILIPILGLALSGSEYLIYSRTKVAERLNYRWFFAGLMTIIVALGFSIGDAKRIMCNPQNHFLQGHAIWHVVAALGIYFVFLFYRQIKN